VLDDDPMRVVNSLFDSSLELVLDSSPPLTHSPKVANDLCLGFFSFFLDFFLISSQPSYVDGEAHL